MFWKTQGKFEEALFKAKYNTPPEDLVDTEEVNEIVEKTGNVSAELKNLVATLESEIINSNYVNNETFFNNFVVEDEEELIIENEPLEDSSQDFDQYASSQISDNDTISLKEEDDEEELIIENEHSEDSSQDFDQYASPQILDNDTISLKEEESSISYIDEDEEVTDTLKTNYADIKSEQKSISLFDPIHYLLTLYKSPKNKSKKS